MVYLNKINLRLLNDLQRTRLSRGRIIRLLANPIPNPLPSVSSTHRKAEKKRQLLNGRGGEGGRGAESYDRKEAWSSINPSVPSEINQLMFIRAMCGSARGELISKQLHEVR
jgi:hypothetical protein